MIERIWCVFLPSGLDAVDSTFQCVRDCAQAAYARGRARPTRTHKTGGGITRHNHCTQSTPTCRSARLVVDAIDLLLKSGELVGGQRADALVVRAKCTKDRWEPTHYPPDVAPPRCLLES